MPACCARPAVAVALWLAGVAPGLAGVAGPPEPDRFWPLLLPNIAVALAGLAWLVLMIRRRG